MGIIFRPFIDGYQGAYEVELLCALPGGQDIEENSFRSSPLGSIGDCKASRDETKDYHMEARKDDAFGYAADGASRRPQRSEF